MASSFVKRYLIALDQHKWIGLFSFTAVIGISSFVALQPPTPPTYKAKGALTYNTPATSFSTTGGQIQEQGKQLSPELLLSPNVITAAAIQANAKPIEIERKVKLKLPKDNKKDAAVMPVIEIEYSHKQRTTAQSTLQVLMEKMIEQSRLVNTTRVRAIIESIEKRIPEAKQELTTAQKQLERYDRIEGPALFAAQDGSLIGAITGSQQQQREIQLTLSGVESQIASLVNRLGLTPEQAYTSAALSADPIIANLRAEMLRTETEREILSKDLRPAHPKMIELQRSQAAYEKLLRQRATEVIGGRGGTAPLVGKIRQDSNLDPARQQLANTLVDLQTQRDTLRQQLEATKRTEQELRKEYQTLPNKQLERARLAQQMQLVQDFYNKLQAQLADAKAAETETVSSLSIAQPPKVAIVGDTETNPAVALGGGIFIGLIVAGGLIFLLATLDNTFYTPEELRQALLAREVSVLEELPRVRILAPDGGETAILANPDSPYLEFYERFRSSLRLGDNKALKVVLLTSTVDREGKTVSAYNLAIASARAGKRTLLVEADLRSPSCAQSLNIVPDPHACIEPLHYYGAKSGCIRLAPNIENLYVVPSPGPQRQAAAILESNELRQFLEDARVRFDFVVIDTPALSQHNDALLLEPLTDGMVLVTRLGYTQESILTEAIDQLIEAELPLLGAVINGVDKPVPLTTIGDIDTKETEDEAEETLEWVGVKDKDNQDDIPTGALRF